MFPLSIPHYTIADTKVHNVPIPRSHQVLFNLWGHHHDPDLFPEPYVFKPERFLTDHGDIVSPGDHPRNMMAAFGFGPRSCAGEALATSRLFLAISNLMRLFDIMPENTLDKQTSCDPRDYNVGIVLSPRTYKVRFVPHKFKVET